MVVLNVNRKSTIQSLNHLAAGLAPRVEARGQPRG